MPLQDMGQRGHSKVIGLAHKFLFIRHRQAAEQAKAEIVQPLLRIIEQEQQLQPFFFVECRAVNPALSGIFHGLFVCIALFRQRIRHHAAMRLVKAQVVQLVFLQQVLHLQVINLLLQIGFGGPDRIWRGRVTGGNELCLFVYTLLAQQQAGLQGALRLPVKPEQVVALLRIIINGIVGGQGVLHGLPQRLPHLAQVAALKKLAEHFQRPGLLLHAEADGLVEEGMLGEMIGCHGTTV